MAVEKEKILKTKQVNLEIASDLYKEIKKHAIDKGLSMKQWAEQAFVECILREKKAQ